MKVNITLDTCADVYMMDDSWEKPAKGLVTDVPNWAWERYQDCLREYNFWQSYMAERLD